MTSIQLDLPDHLAEQAAAMADAAGISLSDYLTTLLAGRMAAEDEVRQLFAARAARAAPGRARAVLDRAGIDNPPRPGDGLDD